MSIFGSPIAYVVYVLIAFWFLVSWLPHRLHVMRIGLKHGWPKERHEAIIELFREGELTSVGYIGMGYDRSKDCVLEISGPWGQHVRLGNGNLLVAAPERDELPEKVMQAFEGYIDQVSDVPYLLCCVPFIEKLQARVPNVRASNIWDLENFSIYEKGCPFIQEVQPGSREENTVKLVTRDELPVPPT